MVPNVGHFANFAQNWLPWQRPLRYQKTRSRSVIYTQNAFIWCKDCENWSSGSWMPVYQMNEYRTISAHFSFSTHVNSKTTEPIFTIFSHDLEQLMELLMRASTRRLCISFQNTKPKSEDGQFWRWQKSPKINRLPWQRLLDYCKTYGSVVISIYTPTNAETLVKTGSVVVKIFGDIGHFRPSRSTIFIFYPILTQKLLNDFHHFFTRCTAISGAINAHICKVIYHSFSEWQSNKCRGVGNFATKLVAMAMSLEESEKLDMIK